MREINENVKKLRKERKISQEVLAKHLGIGRSGYSKKEKCGNFSAGDILKLTQIFGVTPETILGDKSSFILNDCVKTKPVIADLTPLTLSGKEREYLLNLRKLPKKRFNELLKSIEKEAKNYE